MAVADARPVVRTSVIEHKLETLIKKNIFFLTGIIDPRMAYTFLVDVLHQRLTEKSSGTSFWVIINSPGGLLDHGLAIYDTLRIVVDTGIEVNTVAIGDTSSMAVSILQAGTRRYSFPNTQFMIHQAQVVLPGRKEVNLFMEAAKEMERQNGVVLSLIAEHCGMPISELFEISKKTDFSMNAEAALKFGSRGLIDEIITTLPFLEAPAHS